MLMEPTAGRRHRVRLLGSATVTNAGVHLRWLGMGLVLDLIQPDQVVHTAGNCRRRRDRVSGPSRHQSAGNDDCESKSEHFCSLLVLFLVEQRNRVRHVDMRGHPNRCEITEFVTGN
jgi:hypothetical protein